MVQRAGEPQLDGGGLTVARAAKTAEGDTYQTRWDARLKTRAKSGVKPAKTQ